MILKMKDYLKHSKIYKKEINKAAKIITSSLRKGGLIMWCGNGGSASQSDHFAAEFVGKFKKVRKPLRSISLTGNSSVITCISNDFGFKNLFSRQIEGLGKRNDVLVSLSTSGKSANIFKGIKAAKKKGIKTISLLGKGGGKCKNLSDLEILIPSNNTAEIQERHSEICHLICEMIDKSFK